jgi:hypothetical protein
MSSPSLVDYATVDVGAAYEYTGSDQTASDAVVTSTDVTAIDSAQSDSPSDNGDGP